MQELHKLVDETIDNIRKETDLNRKLMLQRKLNELFCTIGELTHIEKSKYEKQ